MKPNQISAQELQRMLNKGEPVFILDVRPTEEREEWSIPESVHIDAYERLKKGDETVFDDIELPKNALIATVCAAGKTSRIAADILSGKGYDVVSLKGGMKAWNYAWNTAELTLADPEAKAIQVRRAAKGCLSYVVGSANEAIVIDAALDPAVYLSIAQENRWAIRYVMDTHIHADYLSRTRELAAASGAKHIFLESAGVEYPFEAVRDGQKISFGGSSLEVMHTPGHTPESVSYLVNGKALLTGDTLFTDGVGRPDLKADEKEAARKAGRLYDSLQRILQLPEDTIILPAHISHAVPFDNKLIGERLSSLRERLKLLNLSKEEFIKATAERIPPTPPNYLQIAQLNKKGGFEGHEPADLEAGANRCALS